MEKTIFSKKHALIKFSVVLLLALFAFCFATMQAVSIPARAEETDVQAYEFDVDTGNYRQGTYLKVTGVYPQFKLTFKDKNNVLEKGFWFGVSETPNIEDVDVWNKAHNYAVDDQGNGVGTIFIDTVARDEAEANGGIYHKYMFFGSGQTAGAGPEYYSAEMVDLRLDVNISDDVYKIDYLSATYDNKGTTTDYSFDSIEKQWISSPITMVVKNNDGEFDNANFYYKLDGNIVYENGINAGSEFQPVKFAKKAITQEGSANSLYQGEAIIPNPESGIVSFEGKITVYSTSFATPDEPIYYDAKELNFYYDGAAPEFTVQPKVAGEDHQKEWAKGDIEYVINNAPVASGATYFCDVWVAGGQKETYQVQKHGDAYSYVVSNEGVTNVQFRAVSNSGVEYSTNQYIARIDKVKPVIAVSAIDKHGAEIRTGGYASDDVTFTVINESKQQPNNTITYQYSLDGEEYQEISNNTGNYQWSPADESIIGKTYYFKILSASGYEDNYAFTISVLKSNYSVTMVIDKLNVNGTGWLNEAVGVSFTMPRVLGIANEYEIQGMITGAPDTGKVLPILSEVVNGDSVTYKVQIDTNLANNSYSFKVSDKANNQADTGTVEQDGVSVENTSLRTTQLKLDLVTPSADVVATINGTAIVLSESDWANGEVLITITPAELISGVNCYPVIEGIVSGVAMTERNGSFTKMVSVGGNYEFRLVSGAGLYEQVSCQVNIDTRDITLEEIIVSTIDKKGNVIEEDIDEKDASLMVANNLKVTFVTNHNDLPDNYLSAGVSVKEHFNIYYTTFTGDEPTRNLNEYERFVAEEGQDPFTFIINMLEEGGNGYLKYAFYLESMATDTNGIKSVTDVEFFTIAYDVRDFVIVASYSGLGMDDQWVGSAPTFTLSLSQETAVGISVKEFQYSLSENGQWTSIPGTIDNKVDFDFEGVENYVDYVDGLHSLNSENTFRSFNGTIYFRAVNAAGHTSPPISCEVKMDTSTPNPLYAVRQLSGENVYDSTSNIFTIYSNKEVAYAQTSENDGEVFAQKAPITYYYRTTSFDGESRSDELEDTSVWTKLTNKFTFTNDGYYWIIADNGMVRSAPYKIQVKIENTTKQVLGATLQGGTIGADKTIIEYNWTQDRASIQFAITSQSATYIWYSLDGEPWTKVEERAIEVNTTGTTYQTVSFMPPSEDGTPIDEEFVIVGNIKKTVKFKITNRHGSEYVIEQSVIIRIDSASPEFAVDLSTATQGSINEEDLSKYFSETIHIHITPIAENPGGVEYTYRVDGTLSFEKMAGAYITTDEILGFSGNGILNLTIRAQAKASLKTYEKHLTLKVDKIAPEFSLKGEVFRDGLPTGQKIDSGVWTNADEVLVSRVVEKTPVSGATYTIAVGEEPIKNWAEGTPESIKEISKIVVTATSGSGLVVEKEFQVNIDREAPIIDAGKIINNPDNFNAPFKYYIDQKITFVEAHLKSAMYNGFPLANGHVIATDSVDNSNNGLVHIVIEDLAGNVAELKFYMTIFDLTVNNIQINEDHIKRLAEFETAYQDALNSGSLSDSRAEYFSTTIGRLKDRLATLEKEVADYQAYLTRINQKVTFDLVSDYPSMEKYLAYFISEDPLIVYPKWQQEKIREGVYETYYNKLLAAYSELNTHMTVVRNLQKEVVALPATNIVEESDYQAVIRVYNAYQSLSNDQKAVFKSTLYTKLTELKRICEVYLLQDEDTGISIDGDHLVGESVGVALEVVNYAESTELFLNAQKTLYETVSEGNPRKIISINKLGLTGYGSQFDTGEITITLPIPNEGEIDYTEYVYFAVYRLSADGTLSPVKNVMRARDGKSVYFNSTQLDTYVLATTANVVVRDEPEKIYGSVAGIEIDATLLTYITFAVIAMFVVFVVIVLLVAIRRRKFLRAYNRDHKNALQRRGITRIPKGNAPPPSNPARPEERVGDTSAVYYYGKKRRKR